MICFSDHRQCGRFAQTHILFQRILVNDNVPPELINSHYFVFESVLSLVFKYKIPSVLFSFVKTCDENQTFLILPELFQKSYVIFKH